MKKRYQQLYNQLKIKVREFYEKLELTSTMTVEQRLLETNKYDRLKKLQTEIAEQIVELNGLNSKQINDNMGKVYELNYNGIAKQISEIKSINLVESKKDAKDTINPFNIVAINKAKDKSQAETNVANGLLNAITQGASLGLIFNAVKEIITQNMNSMNTISTMATTRTENMARSEAAYEANKYYATKKEWVAVLDDKTRDAHREANGQIVDIDKPFIVWGEELMYPMDIAGSLQNTINCRCTTKFIFDKNAKK